jgi:hypothetical protein
MIAFLLITLISSLSKESNPNYIPLVWGNNSMSGVYQCGNERIILDKDFHFYLERLPKNRDVAIFECNDTIAKGKWSLVKNGVIRLNNEPDFDIAPYKLLKEMKLSKDSVYISISLPSEIDNEENKFEFHLFFLYGIGNWKTSKKHFVLPKEMVANGNILNFSMTIKDNYPNCEAGHKCYQRIYFKVFENQAFDISNNFVTISLPNFNQCFVEKMDVENEYLLIDKNVIQWRGKDYHKIIR